MTTGFYLLDNPNPNGKHYYPTARGPKLAAVIHVTAGLEDLDGVDDHSAENTAAYAASTDRQVSWHGGSDADTWLHLLPPRYTAWHVIGYNTHTVGWEISKRHTDWRTMPADWVEQTLRQAAAGLRPWLVELGIPIRRASRAELDRAIATGGEPVGLISHAELQPQDRTDPGWVSGIDTFPWDQFLAYLNGTEEEIAPMFNTVLLEPTVEGEVKRVNVALPWNGDNGLSEVFAAIIAGDAGMTLHRAHWQIRPGGTAAHSEWMVPDDFQLEPLADTGGQAAPMNTRSLVIEYIATAGGSVVIEGKR